MSVLTTQAAAALAAEREAQQTEETNQREALKTAARNALLAVIAPVTWSQSNLSITFTNLPIRLVVVGDGTISLAIRQEEDDWNVYLVTGSDDNWTQVSDKLENLADLGEALEAQQ